MSRLEWGASGTRFYEAGIDRGVLYTNGQPGVAWSGLTSVEENPTGGETKPYYQDGVKYLNTSTTEEFEATISAYTYPVEFGACEGTTRVRTGLFVNQQRKQTFNLSYRTKIGNDLVGTEYGYKIHLVYNASVTPAQRTYATKNETMDPSDFSWSITTLPTTLAGYKNTSHVVIDSREIDPVTLQTIEDVLYGSDAEESRIPSLDELVEIFDNVTGFLVTDNGDDTFTISGPDYAIVDLGSDSTQIIWSSVVSNGTDTYRVSS